MASEVVKYAPKAVIDELGELKGIDMVYELFEQGAILDANNFSDDFNKVAEWVYRSDNEPSLQRELAVINHVLGGERLQPERETRYYVDFVDAEGDQWSVIGNPIVGVDLTIAPQHVFYEVGLDYDTAVKAQALYGGTIEEIK